jgi:hypothetical protein
MAGAKHPQRPSADRVVADLPGERLDIHDRSTRSRTASNLELKKESMRKLKATKARRDEAAIQ